MVLTRIYNTGRSRYKTCSPLHGMWQKSCMFVKCEHVPLILKKQYNETIIHGYWWLAQRYSRTDRIQTIVLHNAQVCLWAMIYCTLDKYWCFYYIIKRTFFSPSEGCLPLVFTIWCTVLDISLYIYTQNLPAFKYWGKSYLYIQIE